MSLKYTDEFLTYLKIDKELSYNTCTSYIRDLDELHDYLGQKISTSQIDRSHIRGFFSYLADKNNQPITRRRKLTALRGFFKFLEDESLTKNNPTKNLPAPKVEGKEPIVFTDTEIKKLIAIVKETTHQFQKRDEVILRLLIETGMRLSELTMLDVADINIAEGVVRVKRKGNREQTIPINIKLASILKKFIQHKELNAPLIVSCFKKRMSGRRVAILIKRYLALADIKRDDISVHSFRHAFCSRLLEKGVDLRTIQILAGHRSIATTELYLHISKTKLRKEVAYAEVV